MTRPITAGVDGTEESLAALDWAAREAVRRGLPLRVVHVWRYEESLAAADRDTQHGWVSEGVREAVRTVSGRHPELEVAVDVLEDGAARALAGAAAEAEMLVLGSRGHGRVVGFLVGSVGQHVIAEASRPVVLVRAEDRGGGGGGRPGGGGGGPGGPRGRRGPPGVGVGEGAPPRG
ncbi:universal stress protein, partial [Streptomyces collinus]|uniref:universal stress protein n=1 Tax=Streptomyces collinus TaxID=42684 RepID=UPI003333594E